LGFVFGKDTGVGVFIFASFPHF